MVVGASLWLNVRTGQGRAIGADLRLSEPSQRECGQVANQRTSAGA